MDIWNSNDDVMLAEIVLRHIREKSTAISAFDEAGKKLNRTPDSCAHRWNSHIRFNYAAAIENAKNQRNREI